jgi:hypothetical protein
MPPPLYPPGKTPYALYRRLGGPQGRSGRVRKISPPTGIRTQDRPARSESLYRLRYRGPFCLEGGSVYQTCKSPVEYTQMLLAKQIIRDRYIIREPSSKIHKFSSDLRSHLKILGARRVTQRSPVLRNHRSGLTSQPQSCGAFSSVHVHWRTFLYVREKKSNKHAENICGPPYKILFPVRPCTRAFYTPGHVNSINGTYPPTRQDSVTTQNGAIRIAAA